MSVNEVDTLLELGASHTLAVVNVLLWEGQIEAILCTLGKCVPKHTKTGIDDTSGQRQVQDIQQQQTECKNGEISTVLTHCLPLLSRLCLLRGSSMILLSSSIYNVQHPATNFNCCFTTGFITLTLYNIHAICSDIDHTVHFRLDVAFYLSQFSPPS